MLEIYVIEQLLSRSIPVGDLICLRIWFPRSTGQDQVCVPSFLESGVGFVLPIVKHYYYCVIFDSELPRFSSKHNTQGSTEIRFLIKLFLWHLRHTTYPDYLRPTVLSFRKTPRSVFNRKRRPQKHFFSDDCYFRNRSPPVAPSSHLFTHSQHNIP